MTQSKLNVSEDDADSFDVTQMADAAFESFAEVFFVCFSCCYTGDSINFFFNF